MSKGMFMILAGVEGLFFIGDIFMKAYMVYGTFFFYHPWFSLMLHPNARGIATQLPRPIVFGIGMILCLVCIGGMMYGRTLLARLAWSAIFFGVVGALWDMYTYGVIMDWVRVGTLALNGSDILIVGGIMSIACVSFRKSKNV